MAAKIDPACPPAAEIMRVVCELLVAILAQIRDRRVALKERVHRARTTTKKCRAALKLIRTDAPARYRRANRDLRDAARALSAARNAEVLVDSLDATLRYFGVPRRKFALVRARLADERRSQRPKPAATERRLRAFAAQIREVRRSLAKWPPRLGFDAIARSYAATHRRARRALHHARTQPGAAAFRAWRKVTKAHFYQCRLLPAAWPADMRQHSGEVKTLAAALGEEHDLGGLRHQLRRLAPKRRRDDSSAACRAVLALVEARRDELRAAAMPLGERLLADKPHAVATRLRRWWKIARTEAATGRR